MICNEVAGAMADATRFGRRPGICRQSTGLGLRITSEIWDRSLRAKDMKIFGENI